MVAVILYYFYHYGANSSTPVEDTQLILCTYKTYYFVSFGKMDNHRLKQVTEPDKHYKINYEANVTQI